MSITLKQFDEAKVLPEDDAKLFNFMLGNKAGIVEGVQISHLGANKLRVSAGWGICQGRMFTVEEETITAKVSPNGELQGRIIINVDTSAESPISFITQAEKTLPDLIEEDLNHSGTVFQLSLATYTINEIIISALKDSRKIIRNIVDDSQKLGGQLPEHYAKENNSWSLSGGIEIERNTDLNTLRNVGNYFCGSNSIAESLKNSPTNQAFTMKVMRHDLGDDTPDIIQIVLGFRAARPTEEYRRLIQKPSAEGQLVFGNWRKTINSSDFDPVKTLAQNAMPKSGGTFTSSVLASGALRKSTNAGELRNVRVTDNLGAEVSTSMLVFERV